MVIKIPTNISQLKKIIHLADIHVRLFKRHEEYRECFETLYKQLRKLDPTDTIIFIGGDIVHAKTDMSPEMVSIVSEFLNNMANITITMVIPGNHDLNLANQSRLDSLSPIIENLKNPNLYYLLHSGVYKFADAEFGVHSIIGDKSDWPKASELTAKTKIAMFHGPVNNAQTDSGFVINNRSILPSEFDGYDMVLLGDIHKHQILQERNTTLNKPIMVYPGSLIQQSYGEQLGNHGWCEWNIAERTFEFKELENSYGYFTLTVRDNRVPIIPDIPPNIRMRVFVQNESSTSVKKILAILKKKYNVHEFIVNRIPEFSVKDSPHNSTEITDVHDIQVQNSLISSFLESHFSMTEIETLKKIQEINTQLNAKIQEEDFSRNIRWKPLRFEFSNMFSYGPNNVINFGNLKGVYGLFSPNASGKTSAFDALMFCLYDKTPRAFKASHVMNNRKNKFECSFSFEINGVKYGIKRIGSRKKDNDVKVDVNFWRIESDGIVVSLNGEDRRDTDANIRSYVGTYEDFILTNLSVQNNSAIFIDKGQSERKDLLGQFMGIDIFDKLYTIALDEMKEISGAIKKFNKEPHGTRLAEIQAAIEKSDEEYEETEQNLQTKKDGYGAISRKITDLYEQKIPTDLDEIDIHKLESRKNNLLETLKKLNSSNLKLRPQSEKLKQLQSHLKTVIVEFESNNIEERQLELQRLIKKHQILLNDLRVISVTVRNHEDKLQKLSEHKYDPECDFCVNNIFVKDAVKTKGSLKLDVEKKTKLDEEKKKIDVQISKFGDVEKEYITYRNTKETLLSTNNDLLRLSSEIETVRQEVSRNEETLKDIDSKIKKYHDSVDIIRKNSEIDTKIFKLDQEKKQIESVISSLETSLRGLHGELQVLKTNKAEIMKAIKEVEELEQTHHAYEYYLESISRDGIPYELISKVIPSIEVEVNNILSQIVEFTVALEVDGKNINGKIVYDYDRVWPLELSSGMERFISGLAIRVALINISNLPKSNFLIIDEGLGTLSAENLLSMNLLFSILKNQFEFIVVISHLDAVRDMVDSLIEIRRDKGFSYISY